MGFVICGALCHAEGGNEQGMAYQMGPGVSEAVMENNKLWYNHQCPLMAATSTGRCNTCVKSFRRRFKLQRLTWPFVELTRHFIQVRL